MVRSSLRVWLALVALFLIFASIMFGGLMLSANLAHWLSDVVPGRAKAFQYSVVVLVSLLVELPLFWFAGLLIFRTWKLTCTHWLSPEEMTRLQGSLRRL